MKFPREHTLKEIAEIIDSKYVGADDFSVLGMNEIHVVEAGDIVFVDHPKYYDKALNSAATIILINKEVECPKGKALLISDDPFRDFNKLSDTFKPFVSTTVSISDSVIIGRNTVIQPNTFIGHNVSIGKNCLIHSNVSIYDDTIIGDNVTIHSGTVLGANAFYYKKRPEGYDRLKSSGRVVIKDNVDIGASCTIDRGVTADTTIGKGSKLDNQIQIGHDTVLGKNCLIASHTGIAGCVIVEDDVTIWGQVGVTSGITIGAKAVILAQSGISKSLEGNKTYFGSPAEDIRVKYKELASIKQLPEILKTIKDLKR
ncbi:MAG: UDP-3-O-(3-hydroxymyristoyl)glucosamine N-acyltransferase [Winogradskyella sp.]|uniref:UDP-3-O-(3-hydroxymyristoyl)glucosamine N-acyltransferase n=1 Tax=Winogradskyella sp. TaxID=1883156 RepID=UPI0017AFE59B|nr:UDP-3-O-(3-hydroxymyristoyl)glucosamine N-acyltransferase [Winogradskyella sp.]MBT8244767.1 UDP-3-O-(3-hydroxymyristoyl)glucosamine N-acyltransferase [Winogradskyella sp.]NNK22893.1 UDP-3-O-(3-hydroxymyristoyl)glucosamine N-acyltransferase [Winogradskyella sp.]